MKPPRLFVVTNRPQRAAIHLFHCDLELVPDWAKIVSDVGDLAAIPTGAKVMSLSFGPLGLPLNLRSLIEQEWREERRRRIFDDDYGAHEAALRAWHDKRWAEAYAPPADPAPFADRQDHALTAARAASSPSSSAHSRQSRWS